MMQPFSPAGAALKQTVTSAGVLVALSAWTDGNGGSLFVGVRGYADVFVRWGGPGITCTEATGHWCPARQASIFALPGTASHVYLITAAGESADVQIAQGRGM